MRTTKHKLGYRLVLCLVVLMLFFSDSSDEQALGFSACYNKVFRISIHPQSKLSELRQKAYKTDYNQNQTQSLHIFSCLGPDKEQGAQNYERSQIHK